ncbi:MAG TPA: dsDNA nuclease domain-containing protein [Gemmatimonadales bacterium]|nr:dsDNA nuclease domain-containing protein [Gemmatimonadales bacterium]
MSLGDALVKKHVREWGGARAPAPLDYQKDWAICKLVELHEAGRYYCLYLEHHEHVIVVDSATAPTAAEFYQIRRSWRRPGAWGALLLRKEGENGRKLSMLGKLYLMRIAFGNHSASPNFVWNEAFNLDVHGEAEGPSTSQSLIRGIDLDEPTRRKVAEALKVEHALTEEPAFERLTLFLKHHLRLGD